MNQHKLAADRAQRELDRSSQQQRVLKQRNDELTSAVSQLRSELRAAQTAAASSGGGSRSTSIAARERMLKNRAGVLDLTPLTPQRHLELSQTAITELERSRHRLLLLTLSLIDRARPASLSTTDSLTLDAKSEDLRSLTSTTITTSLSATQMVNDSAASLHRYDLSDLLLSDAQCRAIFITLLDSPMPWRGDLLMHHDSDGDDDEHQQHHLDRMLDSASPSAGSIVPGSADSNSTPFDADRTGTPSTPSPQPLPQSLDSDKINARLFVSFAKNRVSNAGLFQLVFALIKRITIAFVLPLCDVTL